MLRLRLVRECLMELREVGESIEETSLGLDSGCITQLLKIHTIIEFSKVR